jgi:hypothetical protein
MKTKERKALENRKERIMAELAGLGGMIRGSLVETRKKCGRRECECAKGKLHKHRYLSTGSRGRNKIVYVSDAERKPFADGVRSYEKAWKLICRISEINIRIVKEGGVDE